MSGEAHLIITADGQMFDLRQSGMLSVLAWQGYGLPEIDMQTQRGYKQHGQTTLDYRLQPRTMTLTLYAQGKSWDTYRSARERLYTFLRPNQGGPLTFRHVRSDGSRRDILGRWTGGGSFANDDTDNPFPLGSVESVEITCDDPTFFDPTEKTGTLSATAAAGLFFPAYFGAVHGQGQWIFKSAFDMGGFVITYNGTWRSYPTLTLTGPYSWMSINNTNTGASLLFSVPLNAGEQLIVDLTPGAQSVQSALGVDRIADLSDGNLVDFYLTPGTNRIIASAADRTDGVTSVILSYYERYLGI